MLSLHSIHTFHLKSFTFSFSHTHTNVHTDTNTQTLYFCCCTVTHLIATIDIFIKIGNLHPSLEMCYPAYEWIPEVNRIFSRILLPLNLYVRTATETSMQDFHFFISSKRLSTTLRLKKEWNLNLEPLDP